MDEDTPSDSLPEGEVAADDQLLDFAVLGVDRHCGDLERAPHGWEVDLGKGKEIVFYLAVALCFHAHGAVNAPNRRLSRFTNMLQIVELNKGASRDRLRLI